MTYLLVSLLASTFISFVFYKLLYPSLLLLVPAARRAAPPPLRLTNFLLLAYEPFDDFLKFYEFSLLSFDLACFEVEFLLAWSDFLEPFKSILGISTLF